MPQLSHSVIAHIRAGFPDGVPDAEAAALGAVLQEQLGTHAAHDVLRKLAVEKLLSRKAVRALVPEDEQVRQVSAKLVLGGWPLGGMDEEEDEAPPREGSPLARIVNWLREGYPGGVPEHDYVPLLALLERRLTRSEVKKVAKALRRADVSPAGPSDIAAAITEYTHADPSDKDLRRVRDQLAKKGWPVEFPDPDLP
ncbi:DUF3349 domain-containing protein [Phycicoccus sp. MAQZ13P-2]|uniref:DUF3349 domain-containing protein n=1 Tax=Phycicoccus mangrovi TaxID=2840470 RepID=UPI001C0080AC|nr:DUF3349 domain-containing protein [Phycicoccus mangrovi]MBT9255036.1 DUF3349 domain-containing protein [Phycicoccus mangrovi]MBT9274020.1 DUF3349 domain-containing protein [Phycicoccus mangrovi]